MGNAMKPITDVEKEIDLLDYLRETDKRIYIYYLISRYTGFRVSDLIDLRVRDIKGEYLIIREKKTINRKNKEERKVLIHKDLRRELELYIQDKKDYQYLFQSRKGIHNHLSRKQVYRILHNAGLNVGINVMGAHTGRKTGARDIYINTEDLGEVQNFLGHRDKIVTIKYACLQQELKDTTVLKHMSSPLAEMSKREYKGSRKTVV